MFFDNFKITAEAPTATGTTTIDSAAYDMTGFEWIAFIVRLGTPAANNNIRLQQDTVTGMGAAADLANTLVNDAAKNQHMVMIARPIEGFVRCRVTRGTSTTIDTLVAIQGGTRKLPVTQPTGAVFETHRSNAEGSA